MSGDSSKAGDANPKKSHETARISGALGAFATFAVALAPSGEDFLCRPVSTQGFSHAMAAVAPAFQCKRAKRENPPGPAHTATPVLP